MARIKILGSGSSGNSYILESNEQILLIELGIPWSDIMKGLNFKEGFRKVVGCVVSHRHGDHSKPQTMKQALSRGVRIYSCPDVCSLYTGVHELLPMKVQSIGGYKIMPFKLYHNVENYGYLITCPDGTRIVFATDTTKIPYVFKHVNAYMVEANYSEDIIFDHVMDDTYSQSAAENHMEIKDTISFLKANYSYDMNNIILIHLSNGNSDEKEFVRMTKAELGIRNVVAADKGMVVELIKDEF